MNLHFLPQDLRSALNNLNINFLSEIRLRRGQPVIIQYRGEYKYINPFGTSDTVRGALTCASAEKVLYAAMEKSVYAYSEQLKRGFITVDGGVRIGIAGEYVTENSEVVTIKNISSLNIRIPHSISGIADEIYSAAYRDGLKNTLLFSPPGYGKTTLLRELATKISETDELNVLVFDERNEISAIDGDGNGYNLGINCDVIRGANKLSAFENAIRVMRPQVIITDELSGADDFNAVNYAVECGITVIASSHTMDICALKKLPFEIYIQLTGIGKTAVVYDKDFNIIFNCATVGSARNGNFG